MQFINDIRQYVDEFESEASAEIHKFLDFVHTKYQSMQPTDAMVSLPQAPVVAEPVPTETPVDTPVQIVETSSDTPVNTTTDTEVPSPTEVPLPTEVPSATPSES